jgi:hypothetical protein
MDMTEIMTQTTNATGFSQAKSGFRDGLEEQKILLSRVSKELDDYFAIRSSRFV